MTEPVLTVLTPTLDAERHLPAMLASLAGQTLARDRFEHLVIDGGSTDQTVALIRELSPHTRIITARSTIYEAMNLGLREARGRCFGWLNADDLWEPDALARVAGTLDARPDAEVIIGDYAMFDGRQRALYRVREDVLDRVREGRMRRWFDVWVNPLAVFYQTDFVRSLGGYDASLRLVGDWDLWFRAAARSPAARVAHAGATLGSFRMHAGSLTAGTRPDRLFEEKRRAMERWIDAPDAPPGLRACARRMYRHDTLSLMAVRAGQRDLAGRLSLLRALGRSLADAGPGLAGDLATAAALAAHELAQSVPGVRTLARAAWTATGGPSVSANPSSDSEP